MRYAMNEGFHRGGGDRRNKPEVQEVVNAKFAGAMDESRS